MEQKPGFKTSEFWMMCCLHLLGIVTLVVGALDDNGDLGLVKMILGAAINTINAMGYTFCRTSIKKEESKYIKD